LTKGRTAELEIERTTDAIDENVVLDVVQKMIQGESKPIIAKSLKLSGLGPKNTAIIIKAAESVLRLACQDDLELIKGTLLNQAQMVLHECMSVRNSKTGLYDNGTAIKALTLMAKLTGTFAPQEINVQHNVEYHLEQLTEEQLLNIANNKMTLEEAMNYQPPMLIGKAIEAEFEAEQTPAVPILPTEDELRHRRNR
jgi:hypothetical protein